MDSERVNGEDHLHQPTNEQNKFSEACWCNIATHFGELKWTQEFMAHLKPAIGEEVEKALGRVLVPYLSLLQNLAPPPTSSSFPHQAESSASRSWQLCFKGDLPPTLLTMDKIEDQGTSLEVELLDESGKRVEVGLESSVKIKIDVLDGDFDVENIEVWTDEDYSKNVARPRKNKGELLKGKCELLMSRGLASVSHIAFTDNSKSMRNGTFRLGARVVKGLPPGVVVKAAVSEAFKVKERRLKNDRKHEFPSTEDDLWRLVNIRNNGQTYQRAMKAGIRTVIDFLQRYHTNPEELQRIFGVCETKWKAIVKNAEACKLTKDHYRYYDDASGDILELDCAFNIISFAFKGQISQPYKDLDDFQKNQADKLRRAAYKTRNELENFDASTAQMLVQVVPPYPSSVQQQEEQYRQQPAAPPPPPLSMEPKTDGRWKSPDATSLASNQICCVPPTNIQFYDDATAANQDKLEEHVNGYMPASVPNSFLHEDGEERPSLQKNDWLQKIEEWLLSTPLEEEMGNEVSAYGDVTSKLIVACYAAKAATLFKISVQHDRSVLSKKRKLQ